MSVPSSEIAEPAQPVSRLLVPVLTIGVTVSILGARAIGVFLPVMAADLNTSVSVMGQVPSLMLLLAGLLALIAGPLADRYGYRLMLVAGLLSVFVSAVATGLSYTFPILLIVTLVGAVARAAVLPTAQAVVVTTFTDEDARRRGIGWVTTGLSTAAVVGIPILTICRRTDQLARFVLHHGGDGVGGGRAAPVDARGRRSAWGWPLQPPRPDRLLRADPPPPADRVDDGVLAPLRDRTLGCDVLLLGAAGAETWPEHRRCGLGVPCDWRHRVRRQHRRAGAGRQAPTSADDRLSALVCALPGRGVRAAGVVARKSGLRAAGVASVQHGEPGYHPGAERILAGRPRHHAHPAQRCRLHRDGGGGRAGRRGAGSGRLRGARRPVVRGAAGLNRRGLVVAGWRAEHDAGSS